MQHEAGPSGPSPRDNDRADTQSNGTSSQTVSFVDLGSEMNEHAVNGSSNGENGLAVRRDPNFFGHDREEVTRLLIQSLSDMGYQSAAEDVSRASGYDLESPTVAAFRRAILAGAWQDAEDLLVRATIAGEARQGNSGLVLDPGSNRDAMRFWIRQQKYLELLEKRDTSKALMTLRYELEPLHQDRDKLHFLSGLMVLGSVEALKAQARWDGAEGESRRHLLSNLSSEFANFCSDPI